MRDEQPIICLLGRWHRSMRSTFISSGIMSARSNVKTAQFISSRPLAAVHLSFFLCRRRTIHNHLKGNGQTFRNKLCHYVPIFSVASLFFFPGSILQLIAQQPEGEPSGCSILSRRREGIKKPDAKHVCAATARAEQVDIVLTRIPQHF